MNFDLMTNSQLAAFILGVAFSILAVAAIMFAFSYASKIHSMTKAIILTTVLPCLAIISWMYLILSYVDGLKNDEILNLVISIVLGLVITFMFILVARALLARHFSLTSEDKVKLKEEKAQKKAKKQAEKQKLLAFTETENQE